MAMFGLAVAVLATIQPSSDRGLSLVAAEDEFRAQAISKLGVEADWPFAVNSGYLLCTFVGGDRIVFFFEDLPTTPDLKNSGNGQRGILITLDPAEINLAALGSDSLFAQTASLKELLRRIAPYEKLGESLCDQPPGTIVGPSEI
jgi:hypothetical protein